MQENFGGEFLIFIVISFWGLNFRLKRKLEKIFQFVHGARGSVVNPRTIIGNDCIIRNNIIIGNNGLGGASPIIGNNVNIGSNSCIIAM